MPLCWRASQRRHERPTISIGPQPADMDLSFLDKMLEEKFTHPRGLRWQGNRSLGGYYRKAPKSRTEKFKIWQLHRRKRKPRFPYRFSYWQDDLANATADLPETIQAAVEHNKSVPLLNLPIDLVFMVEKHLSTGERLSLRLSSRLLYINLTLPSKMEPYYVETYGRDMDIALGYDRKTNIRCLDGQGLLRPHSVAFCSDCETVHKLHLFKPAELAKAPYDRHCRRLALCPHTTTTRREWSVMEDWYKMRIGPLSGCAHGIEEHGERIPGTKKQYWCMDLYTSGSGLWPTKNLAPPFEFHDGAIRLARRFNLFKTDLSLFFDDEQMKLTAAETVPLIHGFLTAAKSCMHLVELLDQTQTLQRINTVLQKAATNYKAADSTETPRVATSVVTCMQGSSDAYLDEKRRNSQRDEPLCLCSLTLKASESQGVVSMDVEISRAFPFVSGQKELVWERMLDTWEEEVLDDEDGINSKLLQLTISN